MIEKNLLLELGRKKGLVNKGFIEKDYLLELLLYALSSSSKNELIFKGGTALYKFFGLRRFSEDLDFTVKNPEKINSIITKSISVLESFNVELFKKTEKKIFDSLLIKLLLKGPLYDGNDISLNSLRLDFNLKSTADDFSLKKFSSAYPDIPVFSVLVLNEKEITAEKIRAIMTRDKARDVFDIYYLIRAGFKPESQVINEKLSYYDLKWDEKVFMEKIKNKKTLWEKELQGMTLDKLPEFSEVYELIKKSI